MNTTTALSPPASEGASQELDLSIGGMTCATCSGRVERALRKVPGVQERYGEPGDGDSARPVFCAGRG